MLPPPSVTTPKQLLPERLFAMMLLSNVTVPLVLKIPPPLPTPLGNPRPPSALFAANVTCVRANVPPSLYRPPPFPSPPQGEMPNPVPPTALLEAKVEFVAEQIPSL